MKVGFIGLGVMGKKMALNVLKSGNDLTVYDVVKENVQDLVNEGAKSANSPAELAAECDLVLTSLPNSFIVENVVLGKNGVFEGAKSGMIYVDLSSITPKSIRKISDIAKEKNISVVDAPVSGGAEGAAKGTLTIMAGGDKEVLDKAMPVLLSIGKEVKHVGSVGAGDTVKAVNNLLLGINMVAAAEALVLGKKAGLDPDVMFEIISKSSGGSYALSAKYEKYISKGNFNLGFMVDLMYKDLEISSVQFTLAFGYGTRNSVQDDFKTVFKRAEDMMYRNKLYESSSIKNKTIGLVMNSLFAKSDRESEHSKLVSELCEFIAKKLGMPMLEIQRMRIAGLMHDIGKIGVSENILNKPGKLLAPEWEQIKRHPEIGFRILSASNEFVDISSAILEHHERWDGKGYPRGISGESISVQARIIAIADAYDAMTSERSYKQPKPISDAIDEIRNCSGTSFYPNIAQVFTDHYHEFMYEELHN